MKIKIIWANSWYDPGKEADAAKALTDQGADIIAQHTDSPAAMQMAEQRGIYAFGQDSDMIKFGPKAQLSAIVNNWAPYYIERVKLVREGEWTSGDVWGGLASGFVQMAPYTNMPDDVAKAAQNAEDGIKSGKIFIFSGPINDQTGKPKVADGQRLSDAQILGMDWLAEGIEGTLPK
jgi:simple sugar transport system substrate-binding protein